ncbi:unnamed protein product [Orchesella dallaii]|uniref:beta-N-acetylhexosaminidase n=1 Tax=Orchesella dallaii TaxID=48710 RepID=A0ABP1RVZ4_9HEXA
METSSNGSTPEPPDTSNPRPIVVKTKQKYVHFDLKGMPLKADAYGTIFSYLKGLGVNGVLLEYEDMFPFHGRLSVIANKEAYSEANIKTILKAAQDYELKVIPLVQTFGHMEYVLKLKEFTDLKEHDNFLQCICPSNRNSIELVQDMINQVMKLHPGIEHFHIGSDEVYYLGFCRHCRERMQRFKLKREELFLSHVTQVAGFVKNRHKVQPLMWDDEFRKMDEKVIMKYEIGTLVEIVVWNYTPNIIEQIPRKIWEKYGKVFKAVWIGSAFKGADKPNSIMANEMHYLSNHISWMDAISEFRYDVKCKGIFLTGWQRYDHFSVLCEIFPVAMPSLVTCMLYLNSVGQQPLPEKILGRAHDSIKLYQNSETFTFPGSEIYDSVLALSKLQKSMIEFKETPIYQGWMHDINLQNQFCSPSHVEQILAHVMKFKGELDTLKPKLLLALRSMFPEWSVQEFMRTNLLPIATQISSLEISLNQIKKKRTFPVRPITFSDEAGQNTDPLLH